MLEFSVCIEMFWRDLPMHERVRRVKSLGFTAYEFWGWKNKDLNSLRAVQDETGLQCAVMCMEPNFGLTERTDDASVVGGFAESVRVARSFGCTRLISVPGLDLADETWEATRRRVLRRVKAFAPLAEDGGVTLLLEPLNPLVDHKGAWLTRMCEAADIVAEVGSPNVKILCDLYHQQITEGNLLANVGLYAPVIGHFHTAGVPGRHELVGGELDFRAIFAAIRRTAYSGYIGLEFSATRDADAGLKEALGLLSA
jgi:hydroxypyruvate isomerase